MLNFKLNENESTPPYNEIEEESSFSFPEIMRNNSMRADDLLGEWDECDDFTDEDMDEGVVSQQVPTFHAKPADSSMNNYYSRIHSLSRISEEDKNMENSQEYPSFKREKSHNSFRIEPVNGDQDYDPGTMNWRPACKDPDDYFNEGNYPIMIEEKIDNQLEYEFNKFTGYFEDFLQRDNNDSPAQQHTSYMEQESPVRRRIEPLISSLNTPIGLFDDTDSFLNN